MNKSNNNSIKTVAVLWLLVLGMCLGGQFFYGKIKTTISLRNAIDVISYDYTYNNDDKILYKLPKSWKATENKYLKADDIVYFVDFDSQGEKIYGDIQIIKSNLTLQDVIHKRMEELNKISNISKCKSDIINDNKENKSKICYKLENIHGIITEHEEYYIYIRNNYIKVNFSKLNGDFSGDDYKYIKYIVENIRQK